MTAPLHRFVAIVWIAVLLAGCASAPEPRAADAATPTELVCPPTPNCVTTLESGGDPDLVPLQVTGGRSVAAARLREVLQRRDDAEIVGDDGEVIHAVFTSSLLRFRDDVTFVIEPDGTIHVRSASRYGLWDLGANRARVESLRAALETP